MVREQRADTVLDLGAYMLTIVARQHSFAAGEHESSIVSHIDFYDPIVHRLIGLGSRLCNGWEKLTVERRDDRLRLEIVTPEYHFSAIEYSQLNQHTALQVYVHDDSPRLHEGHLQRTRQGLTEAAHALTALHYDADPIYSIIPRLELPPAFYR